MRSKAWTDDLVDKGTPAVVNVKLLDENGKLPEFKTGYAAGADIYASEDAYVNFGQVSIIKTSIAMDIPHGYEIQVRPRSGLSTKGFIVLNAPGTIDSDFLMEIKVICSCILPGQSIAIKKGDRIGQFVLQRIIWTRYDQVNENEWEEAIKIKAPSNRSGGLGSTGQ